MRDGLYAVEFQTAMGVGAGVVYAIGGRLVGGDSGMYYTGTYETDGDNLQASVSVDRHTSHGVVSVFGVDKVQIKLQGKTKGDTVTCTGTAPAAPGLTFKASLRRLTD